MQVQELDAQGRTLLRCTLRDGVVDGLFEQVAAGSAQRLRANFRDGQLHGPMSLLDAAGAPVQACAFEAGRLHGPMRVYANGQCVAHQQYRGGLLHGACEYFHEGQRVRLAHYQGGLLEGEVIDYGANGAVLQSCTYRANRLHGPLRRYGPAGELREEVHYEQGVPVGASARVALERAVAAPAGEAALTLPERLRRWVRGA